MKLSAFVGGAAALLLAAGSASAQWSDNFDSYANGTLLDNINGWAGWDDIGIDAATVTDAQSRSAPHSARHSMTSSCQMSSQMGTPMRTPRTFTGPGSGPGVNTRFSSKTP